MKMIIFLVTIVVVGVIGFVLLSSQGNEAGTGADNTTGQQSVDSSYKNISPAELATVLAADESNLAGGIQAWNGYQAN